MQNPSAVRHRPVGLIGRIIDVSHAAPTGGCSASAFSTSEEFLSFLTVHERWGTVRPSKAILWTSLPTRRGQLRGQFRGKRGTAGERHRREIKHLRPFLPPDSPAIQFRAPSLPPFLSGNGFAGVPSVRCRYRPSWILARCLRCR